jgi:hypothetical protein
MAQERITVDEFAEVTFSAILRALETRKLRPGGPIIYGIIWFPEAFHGGEIVGPGGAKSQVR